MDKEVAAKNTTATTERKNVSARRRVFPRFSLTFSRICFKNNFRRLRAVRKGEKFMPEIVAQRMFQPIYILLDSVFLVALCAMLFFQTQIPDAAVRTFRRYFVLRRRLRNFFICGSGRVQSRAAVFLGAAVDVFKLRSNKFRAYMDMDFKDENAREWTLFILLWWFVCPLLTDALGNGDVIKIQRTTGAYHGWMAAILFPVLCGVNPVQYFPKRQKAYVFLSSACF